MVTVFSIIALLSALATLAIRIWPTRDEKELDAINKAKKEEDAAIDDFARRNGFDR